MGVLEENSVFQTTLKPEKPTKSSVQAVKEEKPKKGTKRRGGKADPNAPKRPANPFFQFCQEQRPKVMERLAGEPEPSKQELTRQLATTWKSLTSEDKKVCISIVITPRNESNDQKHRYCLYSCENFNLRIPKLSEKLFFRDRMIEIHFLQFFHIIITTDFVLIYKN